MPGQKVTSTQAHYNKVAKERDGGLAFSPFLYILWLLGFRNVIYVMNILSMSIKIKLNFTNKCPGTEP